MKAKKTDTPKSTENGPAYTAKLVANMVLITVVLMIVSTLLIILGFTYMVILLIIGLMPAIVANIVDKRRKRRASKTIVFFNLAGLIPKLFSDFVTSNPDVAAKEQLADPYVWLTMYGFAAFGWFIVYIVPQVSFLFLMARSDFAIKKIEAKKKELIAEWGDRIRKQIG